MYKKLKYIFLSLLLTVLCQAHALAQCSMCRASMENSLSQDSDQFSSGLNTGILYLFIMPYLIIAVIAYFWYKASRKNGNRKRSTYFKQV